MIFVLRYSIRLILDCVSFSCSFAFSNANRAADSYPYVLSFCSRFRLPLSHETRDLFRTAQTAESANNTHSGQEGMPQGRYSGGMYKIISPSVDQRVPRFRCCHFHVEIGFFVFLVFSCSRTASPTPTSTPRPTPTPTPTIRPTRTAYLPPLLVCSLTVCLLAQRLPRRVQLQARPVCLALSRVFRSISSLLLGCFSHFHANSHVLS